MKPYILKFTDGTEQVINLDNVTHIELRDETYLSPFFTVNIFYDTSWESVQGAENIETHTAVSKTSLGYNTLADAQKVMKEITTSMEKPNNFQQALLDKLDKLIKK